MVVEAVELRIPRFTWVGAALWTSDLEEGVGSNSGVAVSAGALSAGRGETTGGRRWGRAGGGWG